jgi:hypothetical protein
LKEKRDNNQQTKKQPKFEKQPKPKFEDEFNDDDENESISGAKVPGDVAGGNRGYCEGVE